jgi:hypothetical protein
VSQKRFTSVRIAVLVAELELAQEAERVQVQTVDPWTGGRRVVFERSRVSELRSDDKRRDNCQLNIFSPEYWERRELRRARSGDRTADE